MQNAVAMYRVCIEEKCPWGHNMNQIQIILIHWSLVTLTHSHIHKQLQQCEWLNTRQSRSRLSVITLSGNFAAADVVVIVHIAVLMLFFQMTGSSKNA